MAKLYYFYTNIEDKDIIISGFEYEKLLKHISFDYQRFFFSSLESYISKNVGTFGEKSNGWSAIRRYYAAFFAAHSIMRTLGVSVSYLNNAEAVRTSKWLSNFGTEISLTKGTHLITYIYEKEGPKVSIKNCNSKGGVHEQFWAQFGNWLSGLENRAVREQLLIADQFLSEINDVRNILRGGGGFNFNWLSTVRNEVNYRHSFDLWLFNQKGAKKGYTFPHCAKIDRKSENIDLRANPKNEPLRAFNSGCDFLVSVSAEIAQMLKQSAPSSKAFLAQNWQKIAATKLDYLLP